GERLRRARSPRRVAASGEEAPGSRSDRFARFAVRAGVARGADAPGRRDPPPVAHRPFAAPPGGAAPSLARPPGEVCLFLRARVADRALVEVAPLDRGVRADLGIV